MRQRTPDQRGHNRHLHEYNLSCHSDLGDQAPLHRLPRIRDNKNKGAPRNPDRTCHNGIRSCLGSRRGDS